MKDFTRHKIEFHCYKYYLNKCSIYFKLNTCFTIPGKKLSHLSMKAAKVAADNLRLGNLL